MPYRKSLPTPILENQLSFRANKSKKTIIFTLFSSVSSIPYSFVLVQIVIEYHIPTVWRFKISYNSGLEMATQSSVLAWRIPGTEEPGGLTYQNEHSLTEIPRLSLPLFAFILISYLSRGLNYFFKTIFY